MVRFEALIQKFGRMGEKTGWTYVVLLAPMAESLLPGHKTSFRVKGKLDRFLIQATALMPMGGGDFLLPLNAKIRKGINKTAGQKINLELELDHSPMELYPDFEACLEDFEEAKTFFKSLSPGHQRYFNRHIQEAKTLATKEKRIIECVTALSRKWDFGQMVRVRKERKP